MSYEMTETYELAATVSGEHVLVTTTRWRNNIQVYGKYKSAVQKVANSLRKEQHIVTKHRLRDRGPNWSIVLVDTMK